MSYRIGVDVDGVLASFNEAYIDLCITVTGVDYFPDRPFDITTWNYPESYGYSAAEVSAVWDVIKASPFFWRNLRGYETTSNDLDALYERSQIHGDEIYFITARPGTRVKEQTEQWIQTHCYYSEFVNPTVLISSHKGLCARALGLDAYIDDKDLNVFDVVTTEAKTFVMDRPWNRNIRHEKHESGEFITRVSSVEEVLALLPEGR